MEEYLSLRFRESAFMIEDQLNEVSKDSNARTVIMNNRTTIMNNRPLALSNGAVFLSNSPFLTSLLFVVFSFLSDLQVKSPIVVSLISKQCGESYFIQLLASIVFICLHRLAEQASIQQDLVNILPIAKLFSMRLCFIPQGLFSEQPSDALITHTPILSLLQQPANVALEQSSKRPRLDASLSMEGMTDSLSEVSTPVLRGIHQTPSVLSSPPPFPTTSSMHVRFNTDIDSQNDEVLFSAYCYP